MDILVGGMIITLGFGSAVAYLPLQVYSVCRLRGGWRAASLLPLLLMLPVVAVTAAAFAQQSNLWPIILIFAAPLATVYLAVLLIMRRLMTPAAKSQS